MVRVYKHRHRKVNHFFYEKVSKPYFGPRSMARRALSKTKGHSLTEEEFLDYLADRHPAAYDKLEWVRFHQFEWKGSEPKTTYRLAIISSAPDPVVRDFLFAFREEITTQTGWYPLVQGSRAKDP